MVDISLGRALTALYVSVAVFSFALGALVF